MGCSHVSRAETHGWQSLKEPVPTCCQAIGVGAGAELFWWFFFGKTILRSTLGSASEVIS